MAISFDLNISVDMINKYIV